MIHFNFKISGWSVSVWVATDSYSEEIYEDFARVGANGDAIRALDIIIREEKKNVGMTYTDIGKEESILLIGLSDSYKEYINTMFHETAHLAHHIANKRGMSEEGICYLQGKLGEIIFLGATEE